MFPILAYIAVVICIHFTFIYIVKVLLIVVNESFCMLINAAIDYPALFFLRKIIKINQSSKIIPLS